MWASLLKISLWNSFQFSACANQPPGFSVSETLTPNGLFQIINGLKRLRGYSKRLHCLMPKPVHMWLQLDNEIST